MGIPARSIDKKTENRRFRNILANSGLEMESGEIRDLQRLFVMTYDGKLINVNDLNRDPEKQTEEYSVKAQADHGETDVFGDLTPTIKNQFGACKVWVEKDGLHARIYFADNDTLADHAFAISDDASYSIGCDWYPDGYEGVGIKIDHPIGILREVSMVITGNDPRAKTIDHKFTATGSNGAAKDNGNRKNNKENKMSTDIKTRDELTRDERDKLVGEITEAIDKITADVPESETEPTVKAEAKTDGEGKNNDGDKTTDNLHMPVVVIRDKIVNQPETATSTIKSCDYLKTEQGKTAFRKALDMAHGRFGVAFEQNLSKLASADGVSGLAAPAPTTSLFISTLQNAEGIISHFAKINSKSYRANILTAGTDEAGRGHGFRKGDTKLNQALAAVVRDVLPIMVYKKLDLDALELRENPELYDFRRAELLEQVRIEIEHAAIIGDGRTAPTDSNPDYRMFNGTRGFYSIAGDAAANSGAGNGLAKTLTAGQTDNLYDMAMQAYGAIKAEGRKVMVAKGSVIAALRTAKTTAGAYVVTPGASIEDLLGVDYIYAPAWMDDATYDAVIFVENTYGLVGDSNVTEHTDFDTTTNTDVLLTEMAAGGSLIKAKAAVVIAPYAES